MENCGFLKLRFTVGAGQVSSLVVMCEKQECVKAELNLVEKLCCTVEV